MARFHGLQCIWVLGAVLAGCGGAASARPTAAAPAAATRSGSRAAEARGLAQARGRLAVVPLRLVPDGPAASDPEAQTLELRGDGVITVDGRTVGRLEGDRIVTAGGRELVRVTADGAIDVEGGTARVQFNPAGEAVSENGARIYIATDGVPILVTPDGQRAQFPGRFENYRPESQTTAVALILATLASARPSDAPASPPQVGGGPQAP